MLQPIATSHACSCHARDILATVTPFTHYLAGSNKIINCFLLQLPVTGVQFNLLVGILLIGFSYLLLGYVRCIVHVLMGFVCTLYSAYSVHVERTIIMAVNGFVNTC